MDQKPVQCACALLLLGSFSIGHCETWAYREKVKVQQETRLDWLYPVLGNSPKDPPKTLLPNYHSIRQRYEFYGPHVAVPGRSYPLVIFVSPTNGPMGWKYCGPSCRANGFLFAGPRDAGNGKSVAHRVRAVLDVLDDVRRRYQVDPDRTYVAGFSGGAAIACRTALHLPEYFGGVVCIGNSVAPPRPPWLLHRARDRLSIAILCGERERVAKIAELLHGPWYAAAGVRSKVAIVPGLGHKMPSAALIDRALVWADESSAARRHHAADHAAARLADAPTRRQWAARLLGEARGHLQAPGSTHVGVAQLQWISQRWPDVPEAQEAQVLLSELEARTEKPWQVAIEKEKRTLDLQEAEGLYRVATARLRGSLPHFRGEFARSAKRLWQRLRDESDDETFRQDADRRLQELAKISAARPRREGPTPLRNIRFNLVGEVSVREGLAQLETSLRALGYRLEVDEDAIGRAKINLEQRRKLNVRVATLERALRELLRPVGLKAQRRGETIRVVPRDLPGKAK